MSDGIEEMLRAGGGDGGGAGEAVERFVAAADRSGLIDVAYARTDTPFGEMLVATTGRGLVRVGFLHSETEEAVVSELATGISPRVLYEPARLDDVRRQL